MSKQEELVLRFRRALADFALGVLKIKSKASTIIPLGFNEAQRIVHSKISAQRRETGRVRVLILKARQEGISTYVAARFFRKGILWRHVSTLVVADEKKRSHKLFETYDRFYNGLPAWLKPPKKWSEKRTHLILAEPYGSSFEVETAGDKNAARATTVQQVHASEVAFWENGEETVTSILQAVPDDDSEVIMETTANGAGGYFYRTWLEAIAGTNGWVAIFLPWFIHEEYTCEPTFAERTAIEGNPDDFERVAMTQGIGFEDRYIVLSVGQLAWRRRTIRDKCNGDIEVFHQEYPATWREAFVVTGNAFFEAKVLESYDQVASEPKRGNLRVRNGGVEVVGEPRGFLRYWIPPRLDASYAIFADTASGKQIGSRRDALDERGGTDFSSAHVFDVTHRAYVAVLHGRMVPELFAEMLFALGWWYSNPRREHRTLRWPALLAVEKNHSSGETVLDLLKRVMRYENLFYQRTVNRRLGKVTNVLGWVTNDETRPIMLDGLAQALREETVSLWDAETIEECRTFVRDENGKYVAQEGAHDDRVMSAAGALAIARHVPTLREHAQVPVAVGSSPTGEFDW